MGKNKGDYRVWVNCNNCGKEHRTIKIPKGTPVTEFLKKGKCDKCGVGNYLKLSKEGDD